MVIAVVYFMTNNSKGLVAWQVAAIGTDLQLAAL